MTTGGRRGGALRMVMVLLALLSLPATKGCQVTEADKRGIRKLDISLNQSYWWIKALKSETQVVLYLYHGESLIHHMCVKFHPQDLAKWFKVELIKKEMKGSKEWVSLSLLNTTITNLTSPATQLGILILGRGLVCVVEQHPHTEQQGRPSNDNSVILLMASSSKLSSLSAAMSNPCRTSPSNATSLYDRDGRKAQSKDEGEWRWWKVAVYTLSTLLVFLSILSTTIYCKHRRLQSSSTAEGRTHPDVSGPVPSIPSRLPHCSLPPPSIYARVSQLQYSRDPTQHTYENVSEDQTNPIYENCPQYWTEPLYDDCLQILGN